MKVLLCFLLIALILFAACARCLRQHTETRTMPGHYESHCVKRGKYGCEISVPIYHPSYQYQISVCDEYEQKDKPKDW